MRQKGVTASRGETELEKGESVSHRMQRVDIEIWGSMLRGDAGEGGSIGDRGPKWVSVKWRTNETEGAKSRE